MSEKFRLTTFYNGLNTFKTAFPELSDAVIEWRERRGPEDQSGADLRKTGYRRGNFTQGVMPCSNPACHEGGYEIDKLVAYMLAGAETEREGILLCSGREIGDEMRRGPVRCTHRIQFKATLTPKAEDQRERERERDQEPDRGGRRGQRRRGRGGHRRGGNG